MNVFSIVFLGEYTLKNPERSLRALLPRSIAPSVSMFDHEFVHSREAVI